MTIERYGITNGELTPTPDGHLVTYDDHEAAIRIQAAKSEAIGIQACMTILRHRCHVWGMSRNEIQRQETFGKLFKAFTEHITKSENS